MEKDRERSLPICQLMELVIEATAFVVTVTVFDALLSPLSDLVETQLME